MPGETAWSIAEALKGYGGYVNSVTTVGIALLAWWKGLPAIIEAGSKLIEVWSNRAASIEDRLNASVAKQFERYDATIASLEKHHRECQDENSQLRVRVRTLEDRVLMQDLEIVGFKRQLAAYEASPNTPNIVPVQGAIVLPPRLDMDDKK